MCKKLYITVVLCTLMLVLASCRKEETTPDMPEKFKIAEATMPGGRQVILLADRETLHVGYNPLYVELRNPKETLPTELRPVVITPLMDMHTMEHSSPVVQPVFDVNTGLYEGAVVFTMPSGEMGTWKLAMEVYGETVELEVHVEAPSANTKLVGTYLGSDEKYYIISLVEPAQPRTGIQDLQVMIHERANMHSFPSAKDLSLDFEPQMPSMGHGSPNNVTPISAGNGLYKGKVNFTMSGDWRLHFTLKRKGTVLVEDAFLDVLF